MTFCACLATIFTEESYEYPSISISQWETDHNAKEGPEFTITTGGNWHTSSNADWIALRPNSGSGCGTSKIFVAENTSAKTRTGKVYVSNGGLGFGTITVTQLGTQPSLVVNQSDFKIDSKGKTVEVKVTSNVEWTYSNSDNQMLNRIEIRNDETAPFTKVISINISENYHSENNASGGKTRIGTLTLQDTEDFDITKVITFKQYDAVTEYLFDIAEDETITQKSSSEYNHALATWAMELSYAAYNPISNELIPGIPGAFMQGKFADSTMTAKADLESKGFEATMFNYENDNSVAAHVIGHKEIVLTGQNVINATGGNSNEYIATNLLGDSTFDFSADGGNRVSDTALYGTSYGISDTTVLSEDLTEISNSSTRQLVVVAVRGSVTPKDWAMDVLTQFHISLLDFESGKDMVMESLYGCKDECESCNGNGCDYCKGYLEKNNITNPIILVTGHSLGAAIANLVAAELNEIEGAEDVYSYTFATPKVKAYPLNTVITQPNNIFNILNTNDVVTYVPTSWLLPGVNIWSRYGIDIPLDMPYSTKQETETLGLFSHSMAVYMNWMNNNKGITYSEIMELSENSMIAGLLPIFVQIKCPVGVTIKDSDGNIIAYESQEEGITYPEVTDTGVVSWITDDGEKIFFAPMETGIASVEIEAYDYGSMKFAVGIAGTTDETEIKAFNDVSLYPGKEFIVEVSEDTLPCDTQLFVTENGEIIGEVTETEPHLKSVEVIHDIRDNEVVTRQIFVTDDTVTEIRLCNHERTEHYLPQDGSWVTIIEDGDELIWSEGLVYIRAGDYVYDVLVESDGDWYEYPNALYVHIPQEYIDIRNNAKSENSAASITYNLSEFTVIENPDM